MLVGAIVPTRNEVFTIGPLTEALDQMCDRVVVADGGSSDGTPFFIAPGTMLTLLGPDSGLDRAYRVAGSSIQNGWWVVHVDAGGSHHPDDVGRLLDIASMEKADVTIGSRFVRGAKYRGRFSRRLASKMAAHLLNRATGEHVQDWTSGLRVYSPVARAVIRQHDFQTTGHAWQIEALWACQNAGCTVSEVPISYRAGVSQLSLRRAWEALRLWAYIRRA